VVFAHPERKGRANPAYVGTGSYGYDVNDFRDFNDAAPDVAIGFESFPGHQKEPGRGGYGSNAIDGGTFGGVGAYAAKVGGLWDAMLGEGRHFWLFASSDFHATDGDFWPGEYQKTYTHVADRRSPQAIVDGLRSGNSFVVSGDLINALDFQVEQGGRSATMGQTLRTSPFSFRDRGRHGLPWLFSYVLWRIGYEEPVTVTIRFKSPETNFNGDMPVVDHVDLIAGRTGDRALPGTAAYLDATNPTTTVLKSFTRYDWRTDHRGWHVIEYRVKADHDMYFRLRGTNVVPRRDTLEIDEYGNPLADSLVGPNTADKAWADLWFYSNPIFVKVAK
jgi:hypothetical protein